MLINITHGFILFTGVMAIFWAVAQLLMLRRNVNNFILSGFYLCIGIMQVYHSFMVTGFLHTQSYLAMVHLPFIYLIGPLFYIFFKFLSREDYHFKKRDMFHLLPTIGIVILLMPIYIQDSETKRLLLNSPPNIIDSIGVFIVYPVAVLIIQVSILLYLLFFIKNSRYLWDKKYLDRKKGILFLYIILLLGCALLTFFIINYVLLNLKFIEFDYDVYIKFIESFSLSVAFGVVIYFLLLVRYPNYFKQLQFEYQKEYYHQSVLEGIDAERIINKIDILLGKEKLYCDDDLNMIRLAKILSIAPYQLSRVINEKMGKNYNTFINEYRINEAKKLLVENPEQSILSITHEVGFNSKSAFYKWFFKFTGQSPTDFKKTKSK